MKKSLRFIIFLQTMAIFIASCNIVNQNNKDEGLLIIDVKFTEKTFGIKMLPSEIEKINIEIYGECLKNKIELTTSYKEPKVFINIIHGRKHILVKGIYSNRIVAYGESSVFVYQYVKNRVEVNLINTSNYKEEPVPGEINQTASISTDITSSPNSSILTLPSAIPTATANPTPSPSSSSSNYLKSSSTYSSNMNTQLKIIISTPIPSGVTVGIFK